MAGRAFRKGRNGILVLIFILAVIAVHENYSNKIIEAVASTEAPKPVVKPANKLSVSKPKPVNYSRNSVVETRPYPVVNTSAQEEQFTRRREEILERCLLVLDESDRAAPLNSKEFLISDKFHLVWCNVFKCASSTWLYNFVKMAGDKKTDMKRVKTNPLDFARKVYERPSVDHLSWHLYHDNYTSFIIVRDPFERLLSAYRDKLESTAQAYYKPLRCEIQNIYGHQPSVKKRDCKPSFPAFIDYLLDEHSKGKAPNEHWAPFYRFCSPCQVRFNYFLRFETLAEDEAFLINKVDGLSSVLTPSKLRSSNTNYEEVIYNYYRQLTKEQLDRLYAIYEKDFKLFGYDADKYFIPIPSPTSS